MDARDIILALGGYRAVAARFSVVPQVVHNWTKRGIASRFWPDVIAWASEVGVEGITLEVLRDTRVSTAKRDGKPSAPADRAEAA